jgi:TonB family protein
MYESKKYTIIGFALSLLLHILLVLLFCFGIPFFETTSKTKQNIIKVMLVTKERVVTAENGEKKLLIQETSKNKFGTNKEPIIVHENDFAQKKNLPIEKIDFEKIKNLLYSNLVYPNIAQKRGWEGIVQIAITINENGLITSIRISKSSEKIVLDDVVLFAANRLRGTILSKPKQISTLVFDVVFSIS